MGKPSRDAVRFTVPASSWMRSEGSKLKAVMSATLGIDFIDIDVIGHDLTIVCRPSQFARFIIRRHEVGLCNRFAELNPSLFFPDREDGITFDVRSNKYPPRDED